MNTEQAGQLFKSMAISINGRDVAPVDAVEKALGKEAVQYAKKKESKWVYTHDYAFTGVMKTDSSHYISYLTEKGFLYAVTYDNIMANGRVWNTEESEDNGGY